VITAYIDPRIKEIARKRGEERGISAEAKKIRNSYYLYKDTTKWDKEEKKRGRIHGKDQ